MHRHKKRRNKHKMQIKNNRRKKKLEHKNQLIPKSQFHNK